MACGVNGYAGPSVIGVEQNGAVGKVGTRVGHKTLRRGSKFCELGQMGANEGSGTSKSELVGLDGWRDG